MSRRVIALAVLGMLGVAVAVIPAHGLTKPTVSLKNGNTNVSESMTSVLIAVVRSSKGNGSVWMQFGGGTATGAASCAAGVDYENTSTLVEFNNQSQVNVSVRLCPDSNYEGNETFRVQLTAPSSGLSIGTRAQSTVTIQDNDPKPALSIDDQSGTEGDLLTFHVSISGGHNVPVSVHYSTADGTAVQPSDYDSTSGDFLWAPGDTSTRSFTVQTHNDSAFGVSEQFTVKLTNAVNGSYGDSAGIGTINEDGASTPPSLAIDDPSVWEGDSGTTTLTFTVTKTGATEAAATVDWTTQDGSSPIATSGASCTTDVDYVAGSGTLTIPAGDSTGTIDVAVCGDTSAEDNELLQIQLSNPSLATISDNLGDGTIKDNEVVGLDLSSGTPGDTTGPVTVTAAVTNTHGDTIPVSGVQVRFEQYRHGSTLGLSGSDFDAIDLLGSNLAGFSTTDGTGAATFSVSGSGSPSDDVVYACVVADQTGAPGYCAQATDTGAFTTGEDTTVGSVVTPGATVLVAWSVV
jgi:hypothetical protein